MPPPPKPFFSARLRSFNYAFRGMGIFFQLGGNLYLHLGAAVAVVGAGFYFYLQPWEWVAVVVAMGFVLAAECFNTALEEVVNLVSPDFHPVAGRAKDLSAAAVLISAAMAAVVGIIVFLPHIWALL